VSDWLAKKCLPKAAAVMSDFEHFAVHKSADSLSVHKARMARPRFAQESQATEDEEDELDFEEDQPDSPAPDTEVQARVDSIALAQKRLTAKSSEKSKFDSSSAPKSRFGRVKLPRKVKSQHLTRRKSRPAQVNRLLINDVPSHSLQGIALACSMTYTTALIATPTEHSSTLMVHTAEFL